MPPRMPMTIVELQAGRTQETVALTDSARQPGTIRLTNLNPFVNSQFLLTLHGPDQAEELNFPIENPEPDRSRLSLSTRQPGTVVIHARDLVQQCVLWPGDAMAKARQSPLAFAPLCDGRLYLRNAVRGSRTVLEATTQFLRDHVWHGEQIIGFVRHGFYEDAFIERGQAPADATAPGRIAASQDGPPVARMLAPLASLDVLVPDLGIDLGARGTVLQGAWYAAAGVDGVHVSVAQPGALAEGATLATGRGRALDSVESDALVYLVAFDLAALELGFALGTDHPRLGWSARARDDVRNTQMPGPDGIATAAPLARPGMVSPALQSRVVATFAGGFKREHGAFRYGALAGVNDASHYGFIEQGVVFSRLNPGLSTLYVRNDGAVGMKTWTRDDERLLGPLRHARQNGVAILERDPTGKGPVLGALLDAWGPGNWSGSADEKLRSLRAGACLVEQAGRRFLVYATFTTATPRAMARVFQAYGCTYAMHLDMNALEHTYMALYRRSGAHMDVQHLMAGMAVLDKSVGTGWVPRFLGFPDDRDFFYLTARKDKP